VTDVINYLLYGRTMRDSNIASIVGVAKKPLIQIILYRNQLIIKFLWFLLKRKRKILNILS
jgi:hypothetical protein